MLLSGHNLDHTARAYEVIEKLDRPASPQTIVDMMKRAFAR